MTCRDVREVADSFLSEQLLTETNHQILQHLDGCPSCRTEIDARRRLRGALRAAFDRAPDLQPSRAFTERLRDQLREAAADHQPTSKIPLRWFALVAAVLLAVAIAGDVYLSPSMAPADVLARDAIGDHRNCALKFRLVRAPVPLEEAAQRFDRAYRVLLDAPPDDIPTPAGPVRVLERHSCAYAGRRFGHIVMRYRDHVVSLLMTVHDASSIDESADAVPHLIGKPMNGLSVMSVEGSHHALLLVSDLNRSELSQLATVVSLPLARRLEGSLFPDRSQVAALYIAQPVR